MPGSVTAPASLITRLPADRQAIQLARLSRNSLAPGASLKRATGVRSPRREWRQIVANRGIILIESDSTGALGASVSCENPVIGNVVTTPVSISCGGATPATVDIDAEEVEAVVYGGAGLKMLAVSAPAGCQGQGYVTV